VYDGGLSVRRALQMAPVDHQPGLAICGEIDQDVYSALVKDLDKLACGHEEVHVDVSAVEFCDLAGLRASFSSPPRDERWCSTAFPRSCRPWWASWEELNALAWL
jgi:hypothetical protein